MIGSLRRHHKWILVLLLLFIIPAFVIFFSPNIGQQGGQGEINFGSIKNRPITREEYANAANEARLLFLLRTGQWPTGAEAQRTGFNQEQETYSRIVLANKLDELNINPSPKAIARWIAGVFGASETQPFPMERYQDFIKNQLAQGRMTAADFQRFARHQVGQQHLVSVYGMSGSLITPEEAETFYRRYNEPLSTEAVFFSATNYLSNVAMTPEALGQFFTNNMAQYRLPERVQVDYIKWDSTNFLAEADEQIAKNTNFAQLVEAAYLQRGTNAFTDADGKPLSKDAAIQKMKDDERKGLALVSARRKASEFLTELLEKNDDNNPLKPGDFQALAKAQGFEVKTSEPFSQFAATEQFALPPAVISAAFRLRENDPADPSNSQLVSSAPVITEDGVYVMALNKRIPSENQPFEKVREQVTEDYRQQQSMKLAREAGAAFEQTLTNGLAQGKTFSSICTEAKVKPVALPHFSLSTQDLPQLDSNIRLDLLQNVAMTLSPGEASRFIPSAEGGLVLHLVAKLPIDEAKLKAELPEFLEQQRNQRMTAAYSEWFQGLIKEMNLVIPAESSSGNS